MARRRDVLETGDRHATAASAVEVPELKDVRGVMWTDHPALKVEIEEIWRAYLLALQRPAADMPRADVTRAFQTALSKVVSFRQDVVHDALLSSDGEKRRRLRAAAVGALVDVTEDGKLLGALDAALADVERPLHALDIALGEIVVALEATEATAFTDAERRNLARLEVAQALRNYGIEATSNRNSALVLILMQLEDRERAGEGDEKQRRYLSSELSKLLKTATQPTSRPES